MNRRVWIGLRTAVAVMVTALTFTARAQAQTTVVLDAPDSEVLDTTIRGGSYASTNFDGDVLATRASSDLTYARRVLLKFDTDSRVPKGATITSAKLTLTVAGGNAETRTLSAYRVAQSFDTWDATWKKRKSSTAWTTAGGDLGKKYATATVKSTVGSKVTFDVTTLVKETVSGTYGSRFTRVALIDGGGSSRASYREFYSADSSNASVRPTLTVVYTTGSTSSSSSASSSSSSSSASSTGGTTLRVFHWNLHHGVGSDGKYDINRIATWIAKSKPDVVSLNEVEKNTSWGNEDQPARYKALLESKTGQKWYTVWAQEFGQWSSNGKGNLLLSRYPFNSTARYELSYDRTVALGQITVGGRNVTVATTHLDPDSGSRRLTQAKELASWLKGFSEHRIVAGDMNGQPTSSEMTHLKGSYYDAWAEAKAKGYAYSAPDNPNGYTRNSRIDFVFTSKSDSHVLAKRVEVVDARDSNGKMPSDHRPILTVWTVK